MHKLDNKRILVTGACGTVGSELVRVLLTSEQYKSTEVIGLDNNESELFFLDQKYLDNPHANFFMADVRDRDSMVRAMQGVNVVFHAAAFKHVVLCERSPYEAVNTNIIGVQNIIHAADSNSVGKVIFTSTDKAVNPTNVMGTSKLMGERLMTAANSSSKSNNTIFSSTRFGNVLGSRGSVIPIFREQIKKGGPVTLTDPEMTRFVMTIEESVRLVIDSALLARGGEVFITKMPVVIIEDIAKVMIDELAPKYGHDPKNIEINVIGTKPGEKLYEELMSHEETRRAVELPRYFSVLPAFRGFYQTVNYDYVEQITDEVVNPYNSSNEIPMTRENLRAFLTDNNLLEIGDQDNADRRYWPGDKEDKNR